MIASMKSNVKVLISIVTFIFIATFIVVLIVFLVNVLGHRENNENEYKPTNVNESEFSLSVLKRTSFNSDSNLLVSPYSISMALNMLKDGANGNTKTEIEKALGNTNTKFIDNKSIHIANALFIKEDYKNEVKNEYKELLVRNHKADVLYDKFTTPKVINNWVNEETDGMIPSILDDISKDFVLGLANAIAIDVKWASPFECPNTVKESFESPNGKMDVEMMHQQYSYKNASFITSDNANGVILQYEEDTNLEYVAILPDGNIDEYIKNLTMDELKKLDESKQDADRNTNIHLSIPRYSYTFDYKSFKEMLKDMGIKDVFDENKSDLTGMMSREDMDRIGNLYVSTAIHKAYIDFNEKGTRAAAVTYFGVDKATAIREEPKIIDIKFNKPFLYMIRDKQGNILFMGVVKEPNKWNGSTCSNKE